MIGFLLRRAANTLVVVAAVATLVFGLIHAAPGDPFAGSLDNPNVTEEVRARWRAAYGLDQPLPIQYGRYLGRLARGDLGWSFSRQQPVSAVIASSIPRTLLLVGLAITLAFAAGVGLALAQARRRGTLFDRVASGTSLVLLSIPDFWLGLLLLLLFSYWLPIFPVGGITDAVEYRHLDATGRLLDRLHHLALPLLTLVLAAAASVARYQRAALLEVLPRDYIRSARAKGVDERDVVARHALRNALMPSITLLGTSLPALVSGVVFVEKVFSWPGMGLVAVDAVASRDYPLVLAVVIVGTIVVAVGSLLADLLYLAADPKLRDA
ncbi:MAG TPA: ABC transporter permease [Gemmatimonadaceae bacterium]|nr:ABC transporter permease [Gemmatimonadaceae bacterium]